jgi:hypothetical protein
MRTVRTWSVRGAGKTTTFGGDTGLSSWFPAQGKKMAILMDA